jgi:serine acetyltransferase
MNPYVCIAPDVKLGQDVKLSKFINLYGCEIGDETKIGAFVEIQKNATVGKRCKISSHTFICEGVSIEDNVFIGHGVMFINDLYPRATTATGGLQTEADWQRGADGGEKRSLDRFRRDHPRQHLHRRKRHRGSGRRGYQRRSRQHYRGRQSGKNSASN